MNKTKLATLETYASPKESTSKKKVTYQIRESNPEVIVEKPISVPTVYVKVLYKGADAIKTYREINMSAKKKHEVYIRINQVLGEQ